MDAGAPITLPTPTPGRGYELHGDHPIDYSSLSEQRDTLV